MGDYTALRGTVKFKDEFKYVFFDDSEDDFYFNWPELPFPATPAFLEFSGCSRSTFIPHGAMCYVDWDYHYYFNIDTLTLSFSCSLKNYDGTIGKFIKWLPEVAESWELEELFEYDTESTFYKSGGL